MTVDRPPPVRGRPHPEPVGIAAHLPRFTLLLVQVAVVGLTIGIERVVVPLLGRDVFGLDRTSAILSFIVAFGLAKAPLNLVAGRLVNRIGRRRVLLLGWSAAIPVPILLAVAPSWSWVVAANVLLGVQQGLCWSTTIIMKVDLVGERERGLAIGLNELVGYLGTAAAAYGGAVLAASYGLRTAPFVALGALVLLGLFLAAATPEHPVAVATMTAPSARRTASAAFGAICVAGLVTKLADVAAWGLLPVHLRDRGLPLATVGALAAAYPLAWAALQPASGWLSDRMGRTGPILAGLVAQGTGLVVLALGDGVAAWLTGALVLGAGTALVYPVLLAAAADAAPVEGRPATIGLYRFWRDLGFVVGGVAGGPAADAIGIPATLLALSGIALVTAAGLARHAPTAALRPST